VHPDLEVMFKIKIVVLKLMPILLWTQAILEVILDLLVGEVDLEHL
jgi:hypothetical protein